MPVYETDTFMFILVYYKKYIVYCFNILFFIIFQLSFGFPNRFSGQNLRFTQKLPVVANIGNFSNLVQFDRNLYQNISFPFNITYYKYFS